MNETLELQIKRLEFCRDCIDQSYPAGRAATDNSANTPVAI